MRLRIRSKLISSILIVILFFGSAATYSVFWLVRDTMVSQKKEQLGYSVMESSHEIGQVFSYTKDLVKTISLQEKISNFLSEPEKQNQEILNMLKGYNIGNKFSAIYLMDIKGDTWVSTDESFVGKNYSFRTYFQEVLKEGKVVVDMAVGVTSKKAGYYFAAPISYTNGDVIGVVVAKMEPENIHNIIHDSVYLNGGSYMFVDNFGVVIYSSKKERIYSSLGTLNNDILSEIEKEKKFPGINIEYLKYNQAQEIVNNYSEMEVIQFFDETDQEEEIIAINKIGDLPFFLVNEIEAKNVIKPAYKIALTLSLFVLGAALMAAFFISLLVNQFLKPLAKFRESVNKIMKGNLSEQVDINTKDEFYDLASVFNKMIKKIKNVQEGIEKKIIKRTAELEKMNKYMVGRELKMIELKEKIKKLEKSNKK